MALDAPVAPIDPVEALTSLIAMTIDGFRAQQGGDLMVSTVLQALESLRYHVTEALLAYEAEGPEPPDAPPADEQA